MKFYVFFAHELIFNKDFITSNNYLQDIFNAQDNIEQAFQSNIIKQFVDPFDLLH